MASPTQYEIIREILNDENIETDALVTKQHADNLATELVEAFEAAGYVIRKKPTPRASKPVETLVLTGDADLDTFIEKHHRPDWRTRLKKALSPSRPGMMSMPSPAPGHYRKPMTQQERADLYVEHRVIQHSN